MFHCQGCEQILDVIHILVECQAYADGRAKLGVEGTIRVVLSNDRNTDKAD